MNLSKNRAALGAALILGSAVLLLFSWGRENPFPPPGGTRTPEIEAVRSAPNPPPSDQGVGQPRRKTAGTNSFKEFSGLDVRPFDLALDPVISKVPREKQFVLQVYSRRTGGFVAGALVAYCPQKHGFGTTGKILFNGMSDSERAAWVLEHGFREKSGEKGRVFLPSLPGGILVVARKGDQEGYEEIGGNWRSFHDYNRLWIGKPRSLEIEVVDTRGNPVPGAPVGLTLCEANKTIWKGKTRGKRGRVQAVIPGRWAAILGKVRIGFSFPFPMSNSKIVDLDQHTGRPVRLVFPHTASLGILFKKEDRKPWLEPLLVSVDVEKKPFEVSEVLRTSRGRIYFPFFGLGCHVTIQVLDREGNFFRSILEFPGPNKPREEKWVELTVRRRGRVRLRALDDKGKPLAEKVLYVEQGGVFRGFYDYVWYRTVSTDSRGFFSLPRPWSPCGATLRLTAWEKTGIGGTPLGPQALLEIPGGPVWEDLFQGDCHFRAMEVLAGGRITDGSGKGLARVRIVLEEMGLSRSKEGRDSYHGYSGTDGKFEIMGTPTRGELGPMKIVLTKEGFLESSGKISPGSRGLHFQMEKAVVVEGKIFFPGFEAFSGLSVRGAKKGEKPVRTRIQARSPGKGSFRFFLPSPGKWRIGLFARKIPLAQRAVEVPPGGRKDVDFQMEGRLELYRVKAVDEEGRRVYAFWIEALHGKGEIRRYAPVDLDLEGGEGASIFVLPVEDRVLKISSERLEAIAPSLVGGGKDNLVVLSPRKDG